METLNNNQQTTGLQTFFNDGINAGIRMKMIDGESWFIAKDICCALGLQDVSMTVKRLDDDEKADTNIICIRSRARNMDC